MALNVVGYTACSAIDLRWSSRGTAVWLGVTLAGGDWIGTWLLVMHEMIAATPGKVEEVLGAEADYLLRHTCRTISRDELYLPGPDFVDRVWGDSDRSPAVLRSMQAMFNHGRLAGTGYLSLLPVDHGVTRGAGSAFASNPSYFDPKNIMTLALEGGCSTVISTYGVLGSVARKYAHKIPLTLKLDHDEELSRPRKHRNIFFARVEDAWRMGCVAVASTIYFGSRETHRRISRVSEAFAYAHELGMVTILFCYLSNRAFQVDGTNHEFSADLTGQANHLGATIEADIVKQKLPVSNGGYKAVSDGHSQYGGLDERIYTELMTDHPIDLARYQVVNGYMGRCGLVSSGGESSGSNDLQQAVRAAVVNKRAGGMGLIAGRKAFQRPLRDGIRLLNAIQDVYLDKSVTIA